MTPAQGNPHNAHLSWTDNTNAPGSVTYNVYRANGACTGATFTKIASGLTALTYTDSGVIPHRSYCYQITAQAGATEGLPCQAVFLPGSITACNCQ